MNVTIDAAANVTVNGVAKGHVLDAVRNDPLLAADIKAAFDQAWLAQMVLARDAQAAAQASLIDAANLHQKALLAQENVYNARAAELQAQIDALGGTELAQQMAKQKALTDAQAALDAAAERVVAAQQELGVATVEATPKEITP